MSFYQKLASKFHIWEYDKCPFTDRNGPLFMHHYNRNGVIQLALKVRANEWEKGIISLWETVTTMVTFLLTQSGSACPDKECCGEEWYCPGKCPKRNVPLKSVLKSAVGVLRLYLIPLKRNCYGCSLWPIKSTSAQQWQGLVPSQLTWKCQEEWVLNINYFWFPYN